MDSASYNEHMQLYELYCNTAVVSKRVLYIRILSRQSKGYQVCLSNHQLQAAHVDNTKTREQIYVDQQSVHRID